MADAKNTPGEEAKNLNADGTPAAESPKGDEAKEPKVGDVINPDAGKDKEPKGDDVQPKTVGLDKFLEEKKARKAAEKRVAELESKGDDIDSDAIADEIDSIAEEFDVNKPFLKKLEKALAKKYSKKEPQADNSEVSSRLSAIEQKERQAQIDRAFDKHFGQAMARMPELKDIVNPDVIKTLSLDPKNKDKTFTQIIEDTYGKSVPGRKTIERTTPGGGKEPEEIDMERARKDSKYFNEIMANPALKKKYNDSKHIQSIL